MRLDLTIMYWFDATPMAKKDSLDFHISLPRRGADLKFICNQT